MRATDILYIAFKLLMWALIMLFAGDGILQAISYSFYKGDRAFPEVSFTPEKIRFNDSLTGYGYNLSAESPYIILCFGGSEYIAYNAVGMYGGYYDCPFIAADYHGTQDSGGKMNLRTMRQTAEELYDWAVELYPDRAVVVIGHSYGCGMAAYLASVRECSRLILISGYRTSADMYNQILPIYWGFLQLFIKNNIRVDLYARETACPVTVISSDADETLSAELQKSLAECYNDAELKIFEGVSHENYLATPEVIDFIKERL